MNDDPFRNWLVDRIAHFDDLAAGSGGTMEQRIQLRELAGVLRCYDAEKAVAATDDAGTSNHAGTTETPRTDDPDDQEVYDAAMREYMREIDRLIATDVDPVGAIAALPKPVKGATG